MEFKIRMLIGVFVLFHDQTNVNTQLTYGSCSKSCSANQEYESTNVNASAVCSCSRSCAQYGDCCFDSPYRTNFDRTEELLFACLPVGDNGNFKIIVSCSPKWSGSAEFCQRAIGYLPPVSSLNTGAAYANIFCAMCNEDADDTTTWNVDLKCCSNQNGGTLQNITNNNNTEPGLYLQDNAIWRRKRIGTSMSECECKFESKVGESFVRNETELRKCYETADISTCSIDWSDTDVRQYCESYTDPVYIENRVYRNLHCATCNYQTISSAACMPSVMVLLQENQTSAEQLQEHCENHGSTSCIHYISRAKGIPYRLKRLFDSTKCIKRPGKKCCDGERFDFRYSQTCKPI